MAKDQGYRKTHSQNMAASTEPSITVERSYEVSFDHSPCELDLSLISVDTGKCKQVVYTAEASIGRPSTSRGKAPSGQEYPICPSPVIREPDENMDLHEALRSHLPSFRQSKRWAKTYLNRDDQIGPVLLTNGPPRKRRHILACDASQQPRNAVIPESAIARQGAQHYDLCKVTQFPGWQAFKQRRLLKRHSVPSTVVRIGGQKTATRRKSLNPLRGQTKGNSRYMTQPRIPHAHITSRCEQQDANPVTPTRRQQHRLGSTSQRSLVSAPSGALAQAQHECSHSPISSLHDYEKVKRFSAECVNMLSGLDFGDEWRVSVVGPSLSVPRRSSMEAAILGAGDQSHKHQVVQSRPGTASRSQGKRDAQVVKRAPCTGSHAFRMAAEALAQSTHSTYVTKHVADHLEDCPPQRPQPTRNQSSGSHLDYKTSHGRVKDLKNVRSIDTLSEIEAQVVDDPSESVIHKLKEKTSSFSMSPSPKRQRPSGEPPERPLPELPGEAGSNTWASIYGRQSPASNDKDRLSPDLLDSKNLHVLTRGEADHVSAAETAPAVYCTSIPLANQKGSELVQIASSSESMSSQDSISTLHTDTSLTARRVSSHLVNERQRRISEIKKRHMAAWTKSQDDLVRLANIGGASQVTIIHARHEPGSKQALQTSSSSEAPSEADKMLSSTGRSGTDTLAQARSVVRSPSHTRSPALNNPTVLSSSRTAPSFGYELQDKYQGRALQTAASTPDLRSPLDVTQTPKQILARSSIMVVVDTDPHTSSIRAKALRPTHSAVLSAGTLTDSPETRTKKKISRALSARESRHHYTSSAELDNLTELISIVKPPATTHSKRGCRGLKSQDKSTRHTVLSTERDATKPLLSSVDDACSDSRARQQCNAQSSSDSDFEGSPLLKRSSNSPSSQVRSTAKPSARRSHRRKDTPLTALLRDEVLKADRELENLKQYEKRIEYLQTHLEQTLKIWSRMSQNGKRQHLASALGGVKGAWSIANKADNEDTDATTSTVASSIYSTRSSVRKLDWAATKPSEAAVNSVLCDTTPKTRRSSNITLTTANGTDTDTDGSLITTSSTLDKRASGGSLTDPQDYDIQSPRSSQRQSNLDQNAPQTRRSRAESLGTNLDDLRARLQATRRPPAIPVRRCNLQTPTRQGSILSISTTSESTSEGGKRNALATSALVSTPSECTSPASQRLTVAPWEEWDEVIPSRHSRSSTERSDGSLQDDMLSVYGEGLSTDQMDAMLTW